MLVLIAIISVLIGAVGLVALVELFPRLSTTATSTTDLDDVLGSSKFAVTNDGYLKVTDVASTCFLWNVKIGGHNMREDLVRIVRPKNLDLEPGETFTVQCTPTGNPIIRALPPDDVLRVTKADVAIVVYYRPWPFSFHRHRLFRFVATFAKNGTVTWEKQPVPPLEKSEFNQLMANFSKDLHLE